MYQFTLPYCLNVFFEGENQFYQQHSTGDKKTASAEPLVQSIQHS